MNLLMTFYFILVPLFFLCNAATIYFQHKTSVIVGREMNKNGHFHPL